MANVEGIRTAINSANNSIDTGVIELAASNWSRAPIAEIISSLLLALESLPLAQITEEMQAMRQGHAAAADSIFIGAITLFEASERASDHPLTDAAQKAWDAHNSMKGGILPGRIHDTIADSLEPKVSQMIETGRALLGMLTQTGETIDTACSLGNEAIQIATRYADENL